MPGEGSDGAGFVPAQGNIIDIRTEQLPGGFHISLQAKDAHAKNLGPSQSILVPDNQKVIDIWRSTKWSVDHKEWLCEMMVRTEDRDMNPTNTIHRVRMLSDGAVLSAHVSLKRKACG